MPFPQAIRSFDVALIQLQIIAGTNKRLFDNSNSSSTTNINYNTEIWSLHVQNILAKQHEFGCGRVVYFSDTLLKLYIDDANSLIKKRIREKGSEKLCCYLREVIK
jgi:hypothetical protein